MIIVTDITILFSHLVSLIVPLQTWNVKYYKYAIIKNGRKSLLEAQLVIETSGYATGHWLSMHAEHMHLYVFMFYFLSMMLH